MRHGASFDVLVIGSGASGLAAAVSAERAGARVALATKTTLQAYNSAKAQGGIQASFGDGRLARAPRRGRHALSSHETADPRSSRSSPARRRRAIHWLEQLGVAFTRENGGYRLARCGGATRKRLLQVGDRTGHAITKALRDAFEAGSGDDAPAPRAARARARRTTAGARRSTTGTGPRRARRRHRRARGRGRCFAEAATRGELSTNHPNATGEVTRIALAAGAEARDLDALQYHPNGGAWPATMQGYSIPETTRAYGAVLLNADGEEFTDSLGPRDVVSQAIFDEVEAGRGVETPDGRPAVWLDTTRIAPRPTPTISLPYMLRRYRGAGIDPLTREDPTPIPSSTTRTADS